MAAKKKSPKVDAADAAVAADAVAEEVVVEADPVVEVEDDTIPAEDPEDAPADDGEEADMPVEAPVSDSQDDSGESEGEGPTGPEYDTGRVVAVEQGEGRPSTFQITEPVNVGGTKIHPASVAAFNEPPTPER